MKTITETLTRSDSFFNNQNTYFNLCAEARRVSMLRLKKNKTSKLNQEHYLNRAMIQEETSEVDAHKNLRDIMIERDASINI